MGGGPGTPVLLATVPATGLEQLPIAVRNGEVYFADTQQIWRVASDGSSAAATFLATTERAQALLLTDTHLFYSTYDNCLTYRVLRSDASIVTDIFLGPLSPNETNARGWGLGLSSSHVFVQFLSSPNLRRWTLPNGASDPSLSLMTGEIPQDGGFLVGDGTTVFWSSTSGIFRETAGNVVALQADEPDAYLYPSASYLFWTSATSALNGGEPGVGRMGKNGLSPTIVNGELFDPREIVADDENVYVFDRGINEIVRIPAMGGQAETHAVADQGTTDLRLAIDDEAIYWVERGPGNIKVKRLVK